jgi:hypothetical protein
LKNIQILGKSLIINKKITKMRKVSTIIGTVCMTVLMAVSASSCKKNDTKALSSIDCTLPSIEGVSPLEEEKAYIDMMDGQIKWCENDKLMVYSIDEDYTKSQTTIFDLDPRSIGQSNGHFSGTELEAGSVGYFMFYPAGKASPSIGANNRAYFNVTATQEHTTDLYAGTSYAGRIFEDHGCIVAASTCNHAADGTLNHIFGYLSLRLKDSAGSGRKVNSVTITDLNHYLTGTISVEIPKLSWNFAAAMKTLGQQYKAGTNLSTYAATLNDYLHQIGYIPEQVGHTMTLDCSATGGVEIINKNKYFMMAVRPGALMNGFTVIVSFTEGIPAIFEVPANNQNITIPGTYTNITIDLASGVL